MLAKNRSFDKNRNFGKKIEILANEKKFQQIIKILDF